MDKPANRSLKPSTTKVIDDLKKPEENVALEYLAKNSVTYHEDGQTKQYSLFTENKNLGKYGVGLYLYFDFLHKMAMVFIIMAVIGTVAMGSNYTGDGLSNRQDVNTIQKLSIANQPQLTVLTTNSEDADEIAKVKLQNDLNIQEFVQEMYERHLLVSCIDLLYTVVFLVFIYILHKQSTEIIEESAKDIYLPYQFAVILHGFPDTVTEASQVQEFVSNYAQVFEVKLARNYYNTLFLHREEADLVIKLKIENFKENKNQKKISKMKAELAKIKTQINRLVEQKIGSNQLHDQYPSLFAFVVFESMQDKVQFIKKYTEATKLPLFNCISKKTIPEQHLFLQKYKLEIQDNIDNPTNIKWENQEITTGDRLWRLALVYLIVFCLMIITFTIVFVAKITTPRNPDTCPQDTYTYDEIQLIIEKETDSDLKQYWKDCFCLSQRIDKIYGDATLQSFCQETVNNYAYNVGLSIASAFVIIFVNFLLKLTIKGLGSFLRYPSLSKELSGTMTKLFAVMFINTAIITLLLNADIFGFKPAVILSSPIPPLQEAQQQTSALKADLDRQWYADVGDDIVNTWIINVVSPHFLFLFSLPLLRCIRRSRANSAQTQREMNTYIVGPQFEMYAHNALTLNTIFVTLFYCSGMPILLWLGGTSLIFQYYSFKYLLLRYNKKPPAFDEQIHKAVLRLLPLAVLLHLCIAIYQYGTPLIFPEQESQLSVDINETSVGGISTATLTVNAETGVIMQRMQRTPWLSGLFFLMIFYYLLQLVLQPIQALLASCCKRNNKVEILEKQKPILYSQVFEQISESTLATYEIRKNEVYKDFIIAMDIQLPAKTNANDEQERLNP